MEERPPSTPIPRVLRRNLTLPWLVLYGLGVTIGAGIFALIGEILALAGNGAPLSFLLAGLLAGATGVSYAFLVRVLPRAGGEVVFVTHGLGRVAGFCVGLAVALTGIVSSAVISLAFAGYISLILPLPTWALLISLLVLLCAIAISGVKQSVVLASMVTLIEFGVLLVIVFYGVDEISAASVGAAFAAAFTEGTDARLAIFSGAVIAFFAFIGFEDIVNLAEETVEAERTVPRAILLCLGLTMLAYVVLALIAASLTDRAAITGSGAPLAMVFEKVSGFPAESVASLAALAMINGVLVQIVMVARIIYGMAGEGLLPALLGHVWPRTQVPALATLLVAAIILILALAFPLVRLAEVTSLLTLFVFTLVNLALFALGLARVHPHLYRARMWGLFAGLLCLAVIAFHTYLAFTG